MSIRRDSRASKDSSQLAPSSSGTEIAGQNYAGELKLGDWVGEYVVLRKLGEGGFGAVYEALHPVIGKRAAVKILHAQYSADEAVTSRFAAEARAVNQIRHRNIVDIFSFGELEDGRQYYVMELLEGVPLDAYLERASRLDLPEALPILSAIAKALKAAHDHEIAHRDLKPENVFLELDDERFVHPKILDFGMAKLLTPGTLPVHKTRSGTPIGSPRYMSPEQCRGVQVDHRTDVYAFGCMAFRILAGVPPFDAGTALELMMAHVSAPPVPLSNVGPDYGPKLDEALLKMMEKLPEKRPQGVLEAFESLKSAAEIHVGEALSIGVLEASPVLLEMAKERGAVKTPELDVSKLRRTPGGSRAVVRGTRSWWLGVLIVVVLTAGFSYWHKRKDGSRQVALSGVTLPLPTALLAPSSGGTPTEPTHRAPELVEQVAITINTQPPQAELYLNKQKVGVAPGPVHLPKSDSSLSLVVRASGYHSQIVKFVPTEDKVLRVVLQPQKARSSGDVPRDLENPY